MAEGARDVLEALRQRSLRGGEPVTVEELVEITGLSEKWVRESLLRLELQGRITSRDALPGESSRGTRLYFLSVEDPSRNFPTDIDHGSQTVLAKPKHAELGSRSVEIGAQRKKSRDWPLPAPIPIIKDIIKRRNEIRDMILKNGIDEL